MMATRKAIVLGHTGFVGRVLFEHLKKDGQLEVLGFSSRTTDLRNPESLARLKGLTDSATILFMVSALTPEKGQTVDTLMDNISMVANVGRFLDSHVVGKCVYLSSDSVYGFDYNPVTEDTPVSPENYYAIAKYAGECILHCVGEERGFPLLTLRLPGVYGPGDPHSAYGPNTFARTLASEKVIRVFGNGEEMRDHLYIDDAARLIAALAKGEVTGVINIATGECRSFTEIVETIRSLVPYEFKILSVPRKRPVAHRCYDITRLRNAVPSLRFTSFEEALKETLVAFGAL